MKRLYKAAKVTGGRISSVLIVILLSPLLIILSVVYILIKGMPSARTKEEEEDECVDDTIPGGVQKSHIEELEQMAARMRVLYTDIPMQDILFLDDLTRLMRSEYNRRRAD